MDNMKGLEGEDGAWETPCDAREGDGTVAVESRADSGENRLDVCENVAAALQLFCDRLSDDPNDYPDMQLWAIMEDTRRYGLHALAEYTARKGADCAKNDDHFKVYIPKCFCGVRGGQTWDRQKLVDELRKNKHNPRTIQFLADMLER